MGQIQVLFQRQKRKFLIGLGLLGALAVGTGLVLLKRPNWLGGSLPRPEHAKIVNGTFSYKLSKDHAFSSSHHFESFSGDVASFKKNSFDENCPVNVVSDIGFKQADPEQASPPIDEKNRPKCNDTQIVFVTSPEQVGLTIDVVRGDDLYQWMTKNPDVQTFFRSEMGEGLFLTLKQALQIRGEDLGIPKIVGPLLLEASKSAISADARIEWIPGKGDRGLIFSFDVSRAKLAAQTFYGVTKYLGKKIFNIHGFENPIIECVLGTHKIFITQEHQRLYIGTSFYGVAAILESPKFERSKTVSGSVVLTLNAAAFLEGEKQFAEQVLHWRNHFGFELSASRSEPSESKLEGSDFLTLVRGSLQKNILRAIPFDVMSAIAFSHATPNNLAEFSWQNLVEHRDMGKDSVSGSTAIIWDFDQTANHLTAVGVATTLAKKSDEGFFKDVWQDPSLVVTCGDDQVLLLASVPSLLTRMKEACNRSSMSLFDWQKELKITDKTQSLVLVNPSIFGRETLRYGIKLSNKSDQPQDVDEKQALQNRVAPNFDLIPIFGFSGETQQKLIAMTGFTKAQSSESRKQ